MADGQTVPAPCTPNTAAQMSTPENRTSRPVGLDVRKVLMIHTRCALVRLETDIQSDLNIIDPSPVI